MIERRSSSAQPLVVVSILLLLFLVVSPVIVNGNIRSSRLAAANDSSSSLPSNTLQSSPSSPNATISVQPNATIDLSRTKKQITIEIALSNTPDVPPLNSISIRLAYDPHVLDAYHAGNLTYSSNILAQTGFPTLLVRDCLDGHAANNGPSSLCGSEDGPGIVSFAETVLGGSTPDGTAGNIFFLALAVNTTIPAFSQISIVQAILAYGSAAIPTTILNGYYSSETCNGPGCVPGTATFTWAPRPVNQGDPAIFSANGSVPSTNAAITDYYWVFNDPSSNNSNQDSGSNSTVSHNFHFAGNYSVTLTITDSNGLRASTTRLVNVIPSNPTGDFDIQASPSVLVIHKSSTNDPFAVGSSTLTLMSLGGFNGTITLQAFSNSNLGLTLAPSTVRITLSSTATSSLTVSAAIVPPGTYFVNITGTSQLFINGAFVMLHHSIGLTVQVTAPPPDFEIQIFNQFGSNVIFAGSDATFSVQLVGLQSFSGAVSLAGQVFPVVNNGLTLSFNPSSVDLSLGFAASQLTVSTTSLTPPGNYTISVIGTSGSLSHTAQLILTVVPPPALGASPSSGPVATLVTVHGSGFLTPGQGPFSSPVQIQMTFDDQLVGLLFLQGNSFNFTFNVPISQTGMHHIHAKELFPSTLDVQTTFPVTSAPGALSVGISVGTIYFRGDTATIFIGTSFNGQAITVNNLQMVLVLPNGSNTTLKAVQISTGYYRATYLVPSTGSLGTYAVLVTAQLSGVSARSALTTFEVKQTWLQSNAHNIATATGVVGALGALGLVALAWRRGFFARKSDSFPDL